VFTLTANTLATVAAATTAATTAATAAETAEKHNSRSQNLNIEYWQVRANMALVFAINFSTSKPENYNQIFSSFRENDFFPNISCFHLNAHSKLLRQIERMNETCPFTSLLSPLFYFPSLILLTFPPRFAR
jgi:hypothetical protein